MAVIQSDVSQMDDIQERNFSRFEFKISFGWIPYIATQLAGASFHDDVISNGSI